MSSLKESNINNANRVLRKGSLKNYDEDLMPFKDETFIMAQLNEEWIQQSVINNPVDSL